MKILNVIGTKYSEKGKPILDSIGDVVYADLTQEELENQIGDYEVLFMQLRGLKADKRVIENGKKLKIIATATTGLDHIDVDCAKSRGIEVLSLKNEAEFLSKIPGTAELAFGLMIDLMRSTIPAFQSVKNYEWNNEKFRGHNLMGQKLGIIGLGRLGKLMAGYGNAFGMNVVAADPFASEGDFISVGCRRLDFDELLKTSDIISIHIHLNDRTQNLFNKNSFSKMKKSAFLINTSRGKIVNEADVLEALKNQQIAGYATDVLADELKFAQDFSNHPLVEYSKNNDNLIIVPHIGGTTYESREATDIFMAEKLKRYIEKTL